MPLHSVQRCDAAGGVVEADGERENMPTFTGWGGGAAGNCCEPPLSECQSCEICVQRIDCTYQNRSGAQ